MSQQYSESINSANDLKSDRLNDEVALFMGCTLNETVGVIFVSLIISLTLALPPVLLLFGKFTIGLAVALVFLMPIFFSLLYKLSRLKRGKPAGYYQQYLKIKLSKTGLIKNPYVMSSCKWSTERKLK